MNGSFFKILIILFLLFGSNIYSQNSVWKIDEANTNKIIKTSSFYNFSEDVESAFSFIKTTDAYYNLELFTIISKQIVGSINMRLEEEPFYENGIHFFKEFSYLDLNLNYTIGKFVLSFSINNLLSFNDAEFSIEPELFGDNNLVNDFYFIQDQNFSIQTAIIYTF